MNRLQRIARLQKYQELNAKKQPNNGHWVVLFVFANGLVSFVVNATDDDLSSWMTLVTVQDDVGLHHGLHHGLHQVVMTDDAILTTRDLLQTRQKRRQSANTQMWKPFRRPNKRLPKAIVKRNERMVL